jgi:carbonic anhydrase/acetyltransferase-like protein (isoleucine patch superfamily)
VLSVVTARVLGQSKNLRVGDETSIGKAMIATHAPVIIGSRVTVNDDVTILSASHDLNDPGWRMIGKTIQIDDYAWIAQGSTILPGVHIGRGAVVGAGAVVSRDVAPYTVVIGNPARPTSRGRVRELEYSPVAFLAPYEAWLEKPSWTQERGAIELWVSSGDFCWATPKAMRMLAKHSLPYTSATFWLSSGQRSTGIRIHFWIQSCREGYVPSWTGEVIRKCQAA